MLPDSVGDVARSLSQNSAATQDVSHSDPQPNRLGLAVLATLVALPLAVLSFSAWLSWRDTWRNATTEIQIMAEAVAQYGERVLSAHAVAAGRVDDVLRGLSDDEIHQNEALLHEQLKALVTEVPQAEAAYVIDRNGAALVTANVFPVPKGERPAADRDFFLALRASDAPAVHVGQVYTGRLDGAMFFAVSRRRTRTGNADMLPGAFDGLVNLSVYPNRIAENLRAMTLDVDDALSLVRSDGELLARNHGQAGPVRIPSDGLFAQTVSRAESRATYQNVSPIDGKAHLVALRQVTGWPVYASVGRPRAAIVAAWHEQVLGKLLVGVPASIVLLLLALHLYRAQGGLRQANQRLEARVTQRTEALAHSEERLRQVLDNQFAFVGVLTPDGTLLEANRAPLQAAGLTLDDVQGKAFWDCFWWSHDPTLQDWLRDACGRAAEGHPVRREVVVRMSGDSRMTIDFQIAPLRDAAGYITHLIPSATDITTRVATQTALRESEEKLRLTLDATALGTWFWEVGAATGRLECDAQCRTLFGVPVDAVVDYAAWSAAVFAKDRTAVEAALARALDPAEPDDAFVAEYRVRHPGGAVRWLSSTGRAYFEPEPKGTVGRRALRILGTIRDVTKAVEIEAALIASLEATRIAAERVQLALDAGAIVGTWIRDVPADKMTVDDRLAETFGLDPALGWSGFSFERLLERVHPEDLGDLRVAVAEALARGGRYNHEYRVRCRDGQYRWTQSKGRVDLTEEGRPLCVSGILIDIQDRRALEAERDRAAALIRAFADAVPGVVFAKDRDGRILVANRGTTALIGKPASFYLGKTDLELLGNKVQAEAIMANDRRIMDRGVAETLEEAVNLPDGTPAVWLSTKEPFRDAEGRVVGIVGTSVDITARKEAEAVLARSNDELEHLVNERTRDLRDAQARLSHAQRMEALGQLAGGIAHDFNNVLQAVQGGARLIEAKPEDTARVRRLVAMVAEAAGRGSAITRRLLSFSRRADLRAEPIDTGELLRDMAQVLSHTLGAGIAVRVDAAPCLPLLMADKGQLETVLVNLATNARDALAGQGMVVLRAEAVEIDPEDRVAPLGIPSGPYLRIAVVDTGTGMPREVLARATDPFFTTKGVGKGTGLGLAMARGFAEQSAGALEIHSTPGEGTTVSLWLPVATQAAAPARPLTPTLSPLTGLQPRVLLVDDEYEVREVTAEGLRDAGFIVRAVEGGREALDLLDTGEEVDVLISDLSMPGMDGLALIREAQRRRPRLPGMLLTGFATDTAEIAVGGTLSGPFSILRKPIEPSALAERVGALLEGVKSQQESSNQ